MLSSLTSLFLVLLCLALAHGACTEPVSCTLQPYNLQYTLCPSDSQPSCEGLKYCCAQIDSFSSVASRSVLRVIGISQIIDAQSGALTVPVGKSVRIEFARPTCIGSVSFSGSDNLQVTSYAVSSNDGSIETELHQLNADASSVGKCNLIALGVSADGGDAVTINSINLCAIGAKADRCGICNGQNICPADAKSDESDEAAASAAEAENSATVASVSGNAKLDARIASESTLVPNVWASSPSSSTVKEYFKPHVVCNARITSDWCFAVFGYDLMPNVTHPAGYVYMPPSRNYFLPSPGYRGQPCVLSTQGEYASFGVCWNCKKHQHTKLSWILTTNTTEYGLVTQDDTATRQANNCPAEYLSWLL